MRWFRDHIRRGAWFALLALAVNLGLSFGHIHGMEGRRYASQIASLVSPDNGQTQGHQDGDQADLLCPVCLAISAMGQALASAPATLPLVLAEASVERTIEPDIVVPQPPRAAFHSRGPPIS
jgi:hypothetical protein